MGNNSFLVVGKVNADISADVPDVDGLSDTKHVGSRKPGIFVGGAAPNVAVGVKGVDDAFDGSAVIKVVTDIGMMPEQADNESDEQYMLSCFSHDAVRPLLEKKGIRLADVAVGEEGVGVRTNLVVGHKGGRDIFKEPVPLNGFFNAANHGLMSRVENYMDAEVEAVGQDGCVFIDPEKPILGFLAAKACEKHGVKSIIDYGSKVWPEVGSNKEELLMGMLTRADIIIVPGDAVVQWMEDNKKDADRLFKSLQDKKYKSRTIIMSDGTDPVKVYHKGEITEIPITPVEPPLYVNGVGDTRDGALMYFLAQGDDVLDAVEKACAIASIKIQYPGAEWMSHIYEHIEGNSLFSDDLAAVRDKAPEGPEQPTSFFSVPTQEYDE